MIKKYIEERKRELKGKKENFQWLKSIDKRIRKLIKSGRDIEVYDWCDFTKGRTGYLDIRIKLPYRLKDIRYYFEELFIFVKNKYILRRKWVDLPPDIRDCFRWQSRWVFTVLGKGTLKELSADDLQYDILYFKLKSLTTNEQKMEFDKDPSSLYRFIDENEERIFQQGPIVTFDNVYIDQESFTQEDCVTYTKLWLSKFYPEYSNRKVIFNDRMD